MEATTNPRKAIGAFVFWSAVLAATCLLYWLALQWLHPGYFAPLTPFHIDFYEYAGMRMKSLEAVLGYPRPMAYLAMHWLGAGGLTGVMVGSIVLAMTNLLLTIAYVQRRLELHTPWLLPAVFLYLALNFTHPDFYSEHRHDLPAQVSYVGLIIALLAWDSWLRRRDEASAPRVIQVSLIILVILATTWLAFSKETYFVSAVCLVGVLAITQPARRRFHLAFIVFILTVQFASLLWTRHVRSPFVDVNAAAESTYRISVHPASVLKTFAFYVYHLINPGLMGLVLYACALARTPRPYLLQACAFPIAGLAAFAPHSLLPNHKFEEYAWAAAPLFLAPILLLGARRSASVSRKAQLGIALALSTIAILGPYGYRRAYNSMELEYHKEQEQMSAGLIRSLDRLRTIPGPARILVIGLTDAGVPWQVPDFIRSEFGGNVFWTIAFPPSVETRHNSRLTGFVNASDVELRDFDQLAIYRHTGELVDLRKTSDVLSSGRTLASMIPSMASLISQSESRPNDFRPLLDCAREALDWGFATEAASFLDRARVLGAESAAEFPGLSTRATQLRQESTKRTPQASLTANPTTITQVDRLGLGATEVIWQVPDGLYVEVHVDAPDGSLFAASHRSGSAHTGGWVRDGTQFFLQNVTGGKPLTAENTLATVKVSVSR